LALLSPQHENARSGHYFDLRLDYVALSANQVIAGNSKRLS